MHDNKLIVGDQKNFGAKTYATVPYKIKRQYNPIVRNNHNL